MPGIADQVEALLSYSPTSWSVPPARQCELIHVLRKDTRLPATLIELRRRGAIKRLIHRVEVAPWRRELLDILAARAGAAETEAILEELSLLDLRVIHGTESATLSLADELWQVRFNLVRLGVPPRGGPFNVAPFRRLIPEDPSKPFTGQGATGVHPGARALSLSEQWGLLLEASSLLARYQHAPGDVARYLANISELERHQQALLVLMRPITTVMPEVWGPLPPTRADVIVAASRYYGHEPALVAAFLLAEQRDQTALEDTEAYTVATSIAMQNTALGLGQLAISTAARTGLLSDAICERTLKHSSHPVIARLLTDDALNIFATARYLRLLATETQPFMTLPALTIRALGIEYTRKPWDEEAFPCWGDFVYEAYKDVKASRIFP